FAAVKNLARTNNLQIGFNDLIVGVFYGTPDELSGHYKKINEDHPVIIGAEFWYRLTGESDFYERLTDAIGDIATEFDGTELINKVIKSLSIEIESKLASTKDIDTEIKE